MNGVIFALAAVVWLVALYAFVRVAIAWLGVMKLAPQGQKFGTALDLGFWNFTAVEQRIGPGSAPHIKAYRQGFLMFFGAILLFMAFVILNIVTGTAA